MSKDIKYSTAGVLCIWCYSSRGYILQRNEQG